MNEWNRQVIAEFRANEGHIGGQFEGAPMVLVHHRGAKSGTERVTPLMYRPDGDRVVIFASKAGATTNPAWYRNLLAHPETTIEIGSEGEVGVRVRELTGDEREQIWEAQKADVPQFAAYDESSGERTIPVLSLERA